MNENVRFHRHSRTVHELTTKSSTATNVDDDEKICFPPSAFALLWWDVAELQWRQRRVRGKHFSQQIFARRRPPSLKPLSFSIQHYKNTEQSNRWPWWEINVKKTTKRKRKAECERGKSVTEAAAAVRISILSSTSTTRLFVFAPRTLWNLILISWDAPWREARKGPRREQKLPFASSLVGIFVLLVAPNKKIVLPPRKANMLENRQKTRNVGSRMS